MFRWVHRDAASVGGTIHRQREAAEAERRNRQLDAAEQEQSRRRQLDPEQLAAEEEQRRQAAAREEIPARMLDPPTGLQETAEPDGMEL